MIVEKNWLTINLKDRLTKNKSDFAVNIKPYAYTKTDFKNACISVANKIAALNRPIYIAFSGGADSENVVRVFKQLNIPFKAITVKTNGNRYELMYADLLYKQFSDINKVYIDFTKKFEYIKKLMLITKTMKCLAENSVSLILAAEYVKKQNDNGILLSGDHLFDCGYDPATKIMFSGFSEWDFYADVLVDDNILIPFYLYDLNIVNSMVEMSDKMTTEEYKQMMYGTIFRPKFSYRFGPKVEELYIKVRNKLIPSKSQVIYKKSEFLKIINTS